MAFAGFAFLTATTEPGYLPHCNLMNSPYALNTSKDENKEVIKTIFNKSDFLFEKEN